MKNVTLWIKEFRFGKLQDAHEETWQPLDLHCPKCGHRGVWWRDTLSIEGGEPHACSSCDFEWRMSGGWSPASEATHRSERLRAGANGEPDEPKPKIGALQFSKNWIISCNRHDESGKYIGPEHCYYSSDADVCADEVMAAGGVAKWANGRKPYTLQPCAPPAPAPAP